jgi:hypothetical protein
MTSNYFMIVAKKEALLPYLCGFLTSHSQVSLLLLVSFSLRGKVINFHDHLEIMVGASQPHSGYVRCIKICVQSSDASHAFICVFSIYF